MPADNNYHRNFCVEDNADVEESGQMEIRITYGGTRKNTYLCNLEILFYPIII